GAAPGRVLVEPRSDGVRARAGRVAGAGAVGGLLPHRSAARRRRRVEAAVAGFCEISRRNPDGNPASGGIRPCRSRAPAVPRPAYLQRRRLPPPQLITLIRHPICDEHLRQTLLLTWGCGFQISSPGAARTACSWPYS